MQRTNRFLCSTASESSHSNITARTRKRSGTSSVGGESSAADGELGSADYASKRKAGSARCSMRLVPSNIRNLRKPAKSGKAQGPNIRSLQNTVVLAPFHSLKKCFQTKLVNFYSYEMIKNMNPKTQTDRKKNTFEYDIIELNSLKPSVKREGKASKKMKGKSKGANYCQCKKTASKAEEKMSLKNAKQKSKTKRRLRSSCLSEYSKTKKKKLSGEAISPIMLKAELSPPFDCYQPNEQFMLSQANLSSSAKGSQSWETYSIPPTLKERHIEGSLAVSTTSFDSYSENANSSKMHVEAKNSDEEIVDFIGGGPQIQGIPSLENQHLLALQRQNKAKAKKPRSEAMGGYYLRSAAWSREKIGQNWNKELQRRRSSTATFRLKPSKIEVATQVERNMLKKKSSISSSKTSQESTSNANATSLNDSLDKTSEKPPPSSSEKPESSPKTNSDSRLSYENSCFPTIDPIQSQAEEDARSQLPEELQVSGEHSDQASMELMDGLTEQLGDPTNSQQSQAKEANFIFGSKNAAARLGESCEFSFGLNWGFSDDDED